MKIISLDMPLVRGEDPHMSINALIEVDGKREGVGLDDSHRNWAKAKEAVDAFIASERSEADEEELAETLYNLVNSHAQVEDRITQVANILDGRMAIQGGHVTIDHDPIDPVLEAHILRMLGEDGTPKANVNWTAFARFIEKLYTNYDEDVRKQLFGWLNYENMTGRGFTLTSDGNFIGYKGCAGDKDNPVSIKHGPAVVDGVSVNGAVPNKVGSTIEMPRSMVQKNAAIGCASGLHVGTWDYASGWARGVVLTVVVDPRDVVSVPVDCDAQKIRVCRYKVMDTTEVALTETTFYGDEDDDWGDYCEECDRDVNDCDCDYCEDCDPREEHCDCGCEDEPARPEDCCEECCNDEDEETDVWGDPLSNDSEESEAAEESKNVEEDSAKAEDSPQEGELISFDYVKRNGDSKSYKIYVSEENDYRIFGELSDGNGFRSFIKDNMSNVKRNLNKESEEKNSEDSKGGEKANNDGQRRGTTFDEFMKDLEEGFANTKPFGESVKDLNDFFKGDIFGGKRQQPKAPDALKEVKGLFDELFKKPKDGEQ